MPEFNQLSNSDFAKWKFSKMLLDTGNPDDHKQVNIELPDGWEYDYQIRDAHVNRIPQSLHDSAGGWRLSAGYMKWFAGLRQTARVIEGQRYLLKVLYRLNIGNTDKPQTVRVFGVIGGIEGALTPRTSLLTLADNGKPQELLYAFDAIKDGKITVGFYGENIYGEGSCDLFIDYIGLELVAPTYGTPPIARVIPFIAGVITPPPVSGEPVGAGASEPKPEPSVIIVRHEIHFRISIDDNVMYLINKLIAANKVAM